jgi:hypothetical protein
MTDTKEHTSAYAQVLATIKDYFESDSGQPIQVHLKISNNERKRLYEVIETYYCGQLSYNRTKHKDETSGEYVVLNIIKVSAENAESQLNDLKFKLTDQIIAQFENFFKVGLPLTSVSSFDYYSKLLQPYRKVSSLFEEFKKDIILCENNINKLNGHVNTVMKVIHAYLDPLLGNQKNRDNSDASGTILFRDNTFESERKFINNSVYKSLQALYTRENAGKFFISIDVNKANFTLIKHFYPDLFKSTWEEFVGEFDPLHLFTLKNSKFLREKLFGDLKTCKKTTEISEFLVRQMLHNENIDPKNVVLLSGDEVVIEYTPELYEKLFKLYHNGTFKVLAFKLVKLPNYNYFVKEYIDGKNDKDLIVTHREFKCVPKNFLCECIKHYEQREVIDLDRQHISDNGRISMYMTPLFL